MPQLLTFLVLCKRGSFFAYGENSAIHYVTLFAGIHIPFEIVKERIEKAGVGSFVLPAPQYSTN